MIYILILILILVLAFFLFWLTSMLAFSPDAPFISIRKKTFPKICDALDLRPGMTVYDLGCGDGSFLVYAAARYPKNKFIGIDSNFLAYFIAKFNARNLGNTQIVRGNFFKKDLSSADRIYVYLFPKVMPKLFLKLAKELKLGSKVVSCHFYFEDKKPESVSDLGRKYEKLYVYKF